MNKFITPLYASPNVHSNAHKINYYLEDVFSLGVTFLQMAGPYSSDQLEQFRLHFKESQLDKAIDQCMTKLSYFHKALLRKMLSYDAEERLNFIQLKDILDEGQLKINLDN